mgnify:CR=1 FL=1
MATISGTPAALAWLMASTVCGMTPSSAATTSTTMSVTLAPRGAHGGERLVAGRVDEGDLLAVGRRHLIGADVLGDAAGLAAGHVGLADGVEQRGLAVVDVAHDGDHGRACGCWSSSASVWPMKPSSTSASDTRLGVWPNSVHDQLGRVGVDRRR